MKRIFMMLTSHRLDCFQLAVDLLLHTRSLERFDRVVLLLNGVEGRHLRYVQDLMRAHPEFPWDTLSGPRGKGERVSSLQNECVRRYPDSLYFKLDEDLYVSEGWIDKLIRAYEAHGSDPNLALLTPVIPNNATGFHYLLQAFPELKDEYDRRFHKPLTPDVNGPVWGYPQIAHWITRRFLDLRAANEELRTKLARRLVRYSPQGDGGSPGEGGNQERYVRFARRFSINCLVYDYRHWREMGGIPKEEELAWGQWIQDHGKYNVLVTDTLLLHYSFFVQQDWLDRTTLLEDIRRVNLPERPGWLCNRAPRWKRIAKQIPSAILRRFRRR